MRCWEQAASDIAANFVERWNYIKAEETDEDDGIPAIPVGNALSALGLTAAEHHQVPDGIGRMKCQVVRSMGEWHNGIEEPDRSIYEACVPCHPPIVLQSPADCQRYTRKSLCLQR